MDPNQLRKIIKEELVPVINTQQDHSKILSEHTEKIDALTEELHTVHQLADTTVDIVKGRYEKNKREIDEIKDHLNLPKEPYFGD